MNGNSVQGIVTRSISIVGAISINHSLSKCDFLSKRQEGRIRKEAGRSSSLRLRRTLTSFSSSLFGFKLEFLLKFRFVTSPRGGGRACMDSGEIESSCRLTHTRARALHCTGRLSLSLKCACSAFSFKSCQPTQYMTGSGFGELKRYEFHII